MWPVVTSRFLGYNFILELTIQIKARHFEAAPHLSKLTATANVRHVTLQKHANDVMWEGDTEHGPVSPQSTVEQSNIEMNSNGQLHRVQSPFDRNSNLRKPCRHKSLEHLLNKSNGKGDRSAWPSIARAGKWNSMEQMRKRGAFIGQRTGSLPAPRPISDEGPNFGKEVGVWQLSEKLDALRSSRDKLPEIKDLSTANVLSRPHSPVMTVIQNLNTELDTASNGHLHQLIRKPAHTQIHRKLNTKEERIKERLLDDEEDRLMPVNQAVTPRLRRTNSLVVKRNRLKVNPSKVNKLNWFLKKVRFVTNKIYENQPTAITFWWIQYVWNLKLSNKPNDED